MASKEWIDDPEGMFDLECQRAHMQWRTGKLLLVERDAMIEEAREKRAEALAEKKRGKS